MPLVINTNAMSLNAQRSLTNNTNALSKSLERLSSGYRINKGADDAAGLQVSETLRAQVRGSKKALDNVQDGMNMLNIADGALGVMVDNVQRMRELAVQAANGTYSGTQRAAMQSEITQRLADINRIEGATEFNGIALFNGVAVNLQVGADNGDTIAISAAARANADTTSLAINGVDVSADASGAITSLGNALDTLNTQRAAIGSFVNQLESASQNLMINIENLSASESRIRNVDVAAESAEMVKNQILQQASAAMLSQANQAPSIALSLLG